MKRRAPHLKGIGPLEWYHPFSGQGWIDFEIEAFGYVLLNINVRPKRPGRGRWMVRVLAFSKILGRSMYGNPSSYGEPAFMFCRFEPHPLGPSGGWLDVAGRRLWQGRSEVQPWEPPTP